MRKLLFILALSVSSCGFMTRQYPMVNADNLKTHSIQKFAQQKLDALLVYLGDYYEQEGFGRLGPEWKIVFLDDYIRTGPGFADGLTIPSEKTVFVYLWRKCLADSSIPHEYGHALIAEKNTGSIRADPVVLRSYQKEAYRGAVKEFCLQDTLLHQDKVFMEAIEP